VGGARGSGSPPIFSPDPSSHTSTIISGSNARDRISVASRGEGDSESQKMIIRKKMAWSVERAEAEEPGVESTEGSVRADSLRGL